MNILDKLSQSPRCFHFLKALVEFGYGQTKSRVKKYSPTEVTTLDLGCGTGEFCELFDKKNYLGLDIYKPYLDFATARYPGYNFLEGDATKLDLENSSFEYIFIHGVVHHFSDQDASSAASEVYRVLKPGGLILLIEDIPAQGLNFPGRLMHSIDRGGWIRTEEQYFNFFKDGFAKKHSESYRSGICDYSLQLLSRNNG